MHTRVYLSNGLSGPLALQTSVWPSAPSGFTVTATSAPTGGAPTELLQVSRDASDMTNGDTWILSTSLTVDGVAVLLQEKVTGDVVGTTLWQRMAAGGADTGFLTNSATLLAFKGASGAVYTLSWDLTLNDTARDDITYALTLGTGGGTS